jgi:CRISPR-associated protein Cst2
MAEEQQLEHLEAERAYRLSQQERSNRIRSLLLGFSRLHGGAKQSIHYTDVSPAVVILAVTVGGNHPFNYLFKESKGTPQFQKDAFTETLMDARSSLLSPVYVGWKPGFLPEERQSVPAINIDGVTVEYSAPTSAFESLVNWLAENSTTWDQ